MTAHICGECSTDSADHDPRCYEPSCEIGLNQGQHWPALCCPGCPCGSYEEAHDKGSSLTVGSAP